jgi:hypothetical protein
MEEQFTEVGSWIWRSLAYGDRAIYYILVRELDSHVGPYIRTIQLYFQRVLFNSCSFPESLKKLLSHWQLFKSLLAAARV